jgi:hypothetical protein
MEVEEESLSGTRGEEGGRRDEDDDCVREM